MVKPSAPRSSSGTRDRLRDARAIGMTCRQVRRMIRHETVITARSTLALGLGLGLFLAA